MGNLSKQEKTDNRMAKREKYKWFLKTNRGNLLFILLNILFLMIFAVSLTLSILDLKYCWINWCKDDIGVLCQIITSIVSFVTSIIGIAITLQKEECWGISIKEFSNLQKGLHYPIVVVITLAILMSILEAVMYVAHLMIASIGIAVIAILFCLYVTWHEIPLMMNNENFLTKTIEKRLWKEWKTTSDLSKELKAVLKYLITDYKNLKGTYKLLESKNEKFNRFLMLKLLEMQTDVAFELRQMPERQRLLCAGSLYKNIEDLICFNLDLSNIFKKDFLNHEYYITRVLFRLNEIDEYSNKVTSLIADSLFDLKYKKFSEDEFANEKIQFIMSITLSMVTVSIRDGEFGFIKALQEKFSINYYNLGGDNYESIAFALISMQLYFLCNDSQNVSEELKVKIKHYLDYSDIIHHTKIFTWKSLYANFLYVFEIDFKKFIKYFIISKGNWDVPIYFEAQVLKLDCGYALRWYVTNILSSERVYDFDYPILCLDEHYRFYLKDLGDKCFDSNKKFVVSDEMKSILSFYGVDENAFLGFLAFEEKTNKFFNFINDLKKDDLHTESIRANNKENEELAKTYKQTLLDAIEKQWGYDASVEITSSPQTMAILIEKASRAINYKEVLEDMLIKSLFHEIRTNLSVVAINRNDEDFDKQIASVLSEDFAFVSRSMERFEYLLKDSSLKKQFIELYIKAKKFESRILNGFVLVKKNGFRFNIKFKEFDIANLTTKEVAEEVNRYKREDGQYVYNGTFLSREEIEQMITKKYAVLKISIIYEVKTFDGAIIEIKLFE